MKKCLTLFAVGILAGCGSDHLGTAWQRIEPPIAAPEFRLPTLQGEVAQLSDYRGQVVILEFWATWCGPCRSSLPSLEVMSKRYRDRGVTVLLVNQQESAKDIHRWTKQRYTVSILLDERGEVATSYGVDGIPQLFVINQQGQMVYRHGGYGGGLERNLALILEELLATPATTHV